MGKKERLIRTQPLEEFFCEQVRSAIAKEKIQTSLHTEYYLVRVLLEFCSREALSPPGESQEVPLAILYLKSFHAGRVEGIKLLKQLADFSLYISGFFQDSLNQKNVDLDYYIALGGNAYHRLSSLGGISRPHDTFSETFVDLSANFRRYMDVLSEISENSEMLKDSDLLKLYEKWLTTGSQRLARKLREFGIFPHLFSKKETLQ
jgi:hypothetical protein